MRVPLESRLQKTPWTNRLEELSDNGPVELDQDLCVAHDDVELKPLELCFMSKLAEFKKVVSAHELFGKKENSFAPMFTAMITPNWVLPANSPIFINSFRWTAKHENFLVKYFAAQQGKHFMISKAPYFCVNRTLKGKSKKFDSDMAARGWKITSHYQFCLWIKPWPIQLPKGFSYSVGRFSNRRLNQDAVVVMNSAFQTPGDFFLKANATIEPFDEKVDLTVIYDEADVPCAAGGSTCEGKSSLLFSGCVLKRVEGKGLWRSLIGIRQSVSASRGVKSWTMTSKNPRITSKSDFVYEIDVFEKV